MNRHDRDLIEIIAMVLTWAIVLAAFFITKAVQAESEASDWFCTERAVVREGDVWKSCGVANAPFENTARLDSLTDAKREFVITCDMDKDCVGHEVTVTPGRTECIKGLLGYTCRRLLVFHVLETKTRAMVNYEQEQPRLYYHPNYYMYMRGR